MNLLFDKLGLSSNSWWERAYDKRIALFRIAFGLVLAYFFGELAFTGKGYHHYVNTIYLFRYPGLDWIPVIPDNLMMPLLYFGFVVALLFSAGVFFRHTSKALSAVFIYVWLLDISHWNNHYYFYALVSIVFMFSNASNVLSLDRLIRPTELKPNYGWELWIFRFIVGVVFFYGGISKLSNAEWMTNASVSAIYTGTFERLEIEVPV